ncbi:MAG: iron-containing alcohol dehydrogenase [Saccharofermentans sp.]|nr:iron-containing alcohol dehydrogenase [Saccharofermentans sp.]
MSLPTYIKYASEAEYEAQSYYLSSGSSYEVCDELKNLGTKRVLFVCSKTISKYMNFSDLVAGFEKVGFRSFSFIRNDGRLLSSDILKGLQIYKEFNCDTIVAVGGAGEIDCGKMISAMHTNNVSNPSELVGIDKLKKDISVLCCIVTDNSCAAAASFAEFFDEFTSKWSVAMSAYLIPQVVVIDTDIAMRTDKNIALDCAITAFGVAVESYLSQYAANYPEYRANAIESCRSLAKYINLTMETPDESYYRRRMAVGGLSAGLSARMTGLGVAHIASHALMSKVKDIRSCVYLNILLSILLEADDDTIARAAQMARDLGLVKIAMDDRGAANALIDHIRIYMDYYSESDLNVPLTDKDVLGMVSDIVKELDQFGGDNKIKSVIERSLLKLIAK